ncbi:MAG: TIGR04053 family radical SAM/SPASM domain-containing protein [Tepidibacillus sp.]
MYIPNYHQAPFITIWEVTRACALKCLHCRAEAQYHRDPRELSTTEGKQLIDQIAEMGSPLLVFTGGDPLMREDIFEFMQYAIQKGLRVSMTPSATPKVKKEAMRRSKELGLARWAFSLDGSTAEIHDYFRGTKGSYDLTMKSIQYLMELKMPIQINTTVSRYNINDLENIARKIEQFGTELWSVFFLVPTGRGQIKDMVSPVQHEEVFEWLHQLKSKVPFDIKTTAAPHFRRYEMQQQAEEVNAPIDKVRDHIGRAAGINDGKGFVFISHIGEVYPSGFLPLYAGNVRETPLAEIYRHSPVFTSLRDPNQYKGKCGACEYREICGGSRARAYAVTGDYLESDPFCIYQPNIEK